jgi:hypothetical protein
MTHLALNRLCVNRLYGDVTESSTSLMQFLRNAVRVKQFAALGHK